MENKTTKNLIVLGAIILFFALTNSTSAYCRQYAFSGNTVGDCVDEQDYLRGYYYQQPTYSTYGYSTNNNVYNPNTSNQTAKPSTSSVVNNYYYYGTPKVATTTKTTTENTSVDRSNTNNTYDSGYNNLGASAYNGYYDTGYRAPTDGNEITALSFRGSGGFMPSSIWQWILVVILILAIIVLARMFVRKPSPADHDTHATHAH